MIDELITGIEDPVEQKACLDLGKEAGLDVAVVTKTVVEHIRNTGVVSCYQLACGKGRHHNFLLQDELNITTAEIGQLSEVPEITKVLNLERYCTYTEVLSHNQGYTLPA